MARKEAAGERIELDEDVFIDSKGIMPNEDHSLEEARLQTMKMLRFQYSRLTNDEDNSAAKRRARMELLSLFDPAWYVRVCRVRAEHKYVLRYMLESD